MRLGDLIKQEFGESITAGIKALDKEAIDALMGRFSSNTETLGDYAMIVSSLFIASGVLRNDL